MKRKRIREEVEESKAMEEEDAFQGIDVVSPPQKDDT